MSTHNKTNKVTEEKPSENPSGKPSGKPSVLLHLIKSEDGNISSGKCACWGIVFFVVVAVICFSMSRSSAKPSTSGTEMRMSGGDIRELAPSVDELMSGLSSF